MYVILHPKKGWFCTNEFEGFGFSESSPDVLYWFDSLELARIHFVNYAERLELEIYYPLEEREKKLFLAPS